MSNVLAQEFEVQVGAECNGTSSGGVFTNPVVRFQAKRLLYGHSMRSGLSIYTIPGTHVRHVKGKKA